MASETDPIIGNWYRYLDKGLKFEVVAIEEESGIIETQYFDGDIEELDLEDWYEMDIEPIAEPEDWTGPMDEIERDDLGYTETLMGTSDWNAPIRDLRRLQEGEE